MPSLQWKGFTSERGSCLCMLSLHSQSHICNACNALHRLHCAAHIAVRRRQNAKPIVYHYTGLNTGVGLAGLMLCDERTYREVQGYSEDLRAKTTHQPIDTKQQHQITIVVLKGLNTSSIWACCEFSQLLVIFCCTCKCTWCGRCSRK